MNWSEGTNLLDLGPVLGLGSSFPAGVKDWSVPLQRALDWSVAKDVGLYLPRGRYVIRRGLSVFLGAGQALRLVSDFAVIEADGRGIDPVLRVRSGPSETAVEIRRLVLSGGRKAPAGLHLVGGLDGADSVVEQVEVTRCLGPAILLQGCGTGAFRNVAGTASTVGWRLEGCRGTVLLDCAARDILSRSGATFIGSDKTGMAKGPVVLGFHAERVGLHPTGAGKYLITDAEAVGIQLGEGQEPGPRMMVLRDLYTEDIANRALHVGAGTKDLVVEAARINASGLDKPAMYFAPGTTGTVWGAVISLASPSVDHAIWGDIHSSDGVIVSGTILIGEAASPPPSPTP